MANYAHIEADRVTGVYDLIPENWRNISNFYVLYESEPELVYTMGWRTLIKTDIVYDPEVQRLGDPTYRIVNGKVIEDQTIIDNIIPVEPTARTYSDAELLTILNNRHQTAISKLRSNRDQLLRDTDYTQLADIILLLGTTLTANFVVYRQALRDLPSLYEGNLDYFDENQFIYPSIPTADTLETPTLPTADTLETPGV